MKPEIDAVNQTRDRHPNNRAGKNNIARISANRASKVMPINRNGSEINQKSGNSTSASKAIGQLTTRRMHHTNNRINAFIANPLR